MNEIPPNVEDLDLASVVTHVEFVTALRVLHARAGKPATRTLEAQARRRGDVLSKSTAQKILSGKSAPRKDALLAWVRACGIPEDDLLPWARAWERVYADVPAEVESHHTDPVLQAERARLETERDQALQEITELRQRLSQEQQRLLASEQQCRELKDELDRLKHTVPPTTATTGPQAARTIWVPPRNGTFTGREELLSSLREALVDTAISGPRVLQGLMGEGKTQIAAEYAHRYGHEYDLVWWIPAENPVLVREALAALAPHLGLSPAPSKGTRSTASDVLDALRRGVPSGKWLLIFNDADQPEDLHEYVHQQNGHVLVTSRNHRWASVAHTLTVGVFNRVESIDFLQRRTRNSLRPAEANRLARELSDLPLALAQAAVLLFEHGMSASEYLEQLAERPSELLRQGRPADYPLPLTAASSVMMSSLSEALPEAVSLLRIYAFLDLNPLPGSALSRTPSGLDPDIAHLTSDPIRLGRAIDELARYGCARLFLPGRTLHIPQLTRRLIQDDLPAEERERMRHQAKLLRAAYDSGGPNGRDDEA